MSCLCSALLAEGDYVCPVIDIVPVSRWMGTSVQIPQVIADRAGLERQRAFNAKSGR